MTSPLGLAQPTLDVIAAAYAAIVLERERALVHTPTDAPWEPDPAAGHIRVGDDEIAATTLGYVAADGTWRWAWSEEVLGPDAAATRALHRLRDVGAEHDIPELVRPSVPLSSLSDPGRGPEHTIVTAASGLLGGRAISATPYEDGTAFLVVTDQTFVLPAPALDEIASLMQEALSAYPYDNRLTVETYLGVHGLSATAYDGLVVAAFPDAREARFEFDSSDRLVALEITD